VNAWNISEIEEEKSKEMQKSWGEWSEKRVVLLEERTIQELKEEVVVIRNKITRVLSQKEKKVRICARSKRWWNARRMENRKIMGFMRRERRAGRTNHASIKGARKELRKTIRKSKRWWWNSFTQEVDGDEVWRALIYTG
jgi:hypothetical protein